MAAMVVVTIVDDYSLRLSGIHCLRIGAVLHLGRIGDRRLLLIWLIAARVSSLLLLRIVGLLRLWELLIFRRIGRRRTGHFLKLY